MHKCDRGSLPEPSLAFWQRNRDISGREDRNKVFARNF